MAKAFCQLLMWPKWSLCLVLAGFSATAWAEGEIDQCAQARDPTQCEARQKALASCADMHGAYKRACLEAALPAVDCTRAKNPERCQAAQSAKVAAKAACQGKTDQELQSCLKSENAKAKREAQATAKARKAPKAKSSSTGKKKAKARKAKAKAKTKRTPPG